MPLYPAARVDTLHLPTDHGYVGWTFDPALAQAGTVLPTAGLVQVARLRVLTAAVTNIIIHISTAGSTLTAGQCFAALYNDAGALLGAGAVTADQAGAWASTGLKVMPLTVAQAVVPNAWYRVAFWFNGTTGPTLSRAVTTAVAGLPNPGMSAPTFRFSTADSSITTTAPGSLAAQTAILSAYWVAVS